MEWTGHLLHRHTSLTTCLPPPGPRSHSFPCPGRLCRCPARPPLGGALYALGSMLPFLADAISYFASVISLFFIKANFQELRVAARRKLWVEIGEGLGWLWHQPLIRSMALLTGGNNLISAGFILIVIVLAQHMQASSFTIGIIDRKSV